MNLYFYINNQEQNCKTNNKNIFSIKNHIKDKPLLQPPQTPKRKSNVKNEPFAFPSTTKNKTVKLTIKDEH